VIIAHPNAPQGSVVTLPHYSPSSFGPNDAVLCRNAAPLLSFAFSLLRRGVACHVLGRDIASGLEKLLDRVGGSSLSLARENLEHYRQRESAKLRARGKRQECANVEDKCSCLELFFAGANSVEDVKRKIESLFKAGPGVTLATVHKAKGLEWDNVFILDKGALMPSRWATAPWEQAQERNIIYVAVTRARVNLFYTYRS